jgi:hypothetical protein
MCLGIMPSKTVATVYGFHELYQLGRATINGDINSFESIITQHQASFIRLGIYLVLEQVKSTVYRNLFAKIFKLSDNNTRLNLHLFQSVFKWLNHDIELDEIECIIANLIYQNKIKGYISHEKRYLIVSKTDPFPISAIVKLPNAV